MLRSRPLLGATWATWPGRERRKRPNLNRWEDNDERHEAAETYRSDLTNINWGRIRKINRLIVGILTIWITEIIIKDIKEGSHKVC